MSRLPKVVPVLTEKDICQGEFNGPHNTHCLAQWMQICGLLNLDGHYDGDLEIDPERDKILLTFVKEIAEQAINKDSSILPFFVSYNDRQPRKAVADLWNMVMEKSGYKRNGNFFVLEVKNDTSRTP